MAEPISFPSTTTNFSLPLLFAGQAQKEFFVNQSLTLVDALMTNSALDSISTPPTNPGEGAVYRIVSSADGDWAGHDDEIAIFIGSAWHFVTPKTGQTLFDVQSGAFLHYNAGWQSPVEPAQATGGTTIDTEARQMLAGLVEALQKAGVFSNTV